MIYKVFHKYNSYFLSKQVDNYKTTLKKKMVWILRYKDPKNQEKYKHIDSDEYFNSFMREMGALNEILKFPDPIPRIMTLLEMAKTESRKPNSSWTRFRKTILEARAMIDSIADELPPESEVVQK